MIVPDGLVYASVVPLCGLTLKVGQDVMLRYKKNAQINARVDNPPINPPVSPAISLDDFQQIGDLLTEKLNGRYMFATEARDRFAKMELLLSDSIHELKLFIVDEFAKGNLA